MTFLILRLVSTVACGVIAFSCHLYWDLSANPGHGLETSIDWATPTGVVGAIWAWLVFPKMGYSWIKDMVLIAVAFPAVGAISGSIIPGIGTYVGVRTALSLPFDYPLPIGGLYAFGALLAFVLPRLRVPLKARS